MIWSLKKIPLQKDIETLATEINISPSLAQLLISRGVLNYSDAKNFFRPNAQMLHEPLLMKDLEKAIHRIILAIKQNQKILIYGDYDVDGTTSVAMMYMFIRSIYPKVEYYIPNRYTEGYGISNKGIDFAINNDFKLIISLDCGIKAVKTITKAQNNNIDFIICDHHLPGDIIPPAFAILNPKQTDCNYPFKELSGCGVGFKLIQGIANYLEMPREKYFKYLDLVAISIAADLVPIHGENRTLATLGIQKINTNPSNAIKQLLGDLKYQNTTISNLVFSIAPKINAAGRMKHAHFSVDLLTNEDKQKVKDLNIFINDLNDQRRNFDKLITKQALYQIIQNKEENCYSSVLYQEDWHVGVLGIVASRLIDSYYRPTVILTKVEDKWVGSVRSIPSFDVYKALKNCSQHLEQFGGHKFAAGITIHSNKLKEFKNAFEQEVKLVLNSQKTEPKIDIDVEVNLQEITESYKKVLLQFAPFGPQNMKPVFLSQNVKIKGYPQNVGKDGRHLKLKVFSENSRIFDAIGFNLGHLSEQILLNPHFNMAYTIEENNYRGKTYLQLNVKDIKFKNYT